MKPNCTLTALAMASVVFLVGDGAFAQSSAAERTAVEEAETSVERQARGEIESLIGRLCPGRCELVELEVTAGEPETIGDVSPGFDTTGGPSQYEVEVRRIEATVMMDSNLPENFQANLPRMAQFRLQNLASDVEVRPELLEFPEPQMPPMPDPPEQPPEPLPQPEPLPELEPVEPPEPEEDEQLEQQPAEPEPVAAQEDEPLWQQALPWIALLMTLLILGGLIILILRRLEQLTAGDDEEVGAQRYPDDDTETTMPDAEALREELTTSRSALNRMLRTWIEDDPREVAVLIRLVGPEILSDVRRDPQTRPKLDVVSDHVAEMQQGLDPEEANSIARKARSRYEAELVVEDAGADIEWDFLEGLTLGQITKLLDQASRREKGFVLTRLPPVLRSRYLEGLAPRRRRELMLEASSSEELTRTESRKLAARLREIAGEFPDHTREAEGRAQMITDMLDAMGLAEQHEVLEELRNERPDVADSVLSRICLESALVHIPEQLLADTVHRMPVETMARFLQGTEDEITGWVLDVAPASKRQAVSTELSLDIPTSRAEFLDARRKFSDAVVATLRKNGYDIAEFNTEALRADTRQSSRTEVPQ